MNFSFIQITDTHIFADKRIHHNADSCQILKKAVNHIKTNYSNIDFIIHTGDVSGLEGFEEDYAVYNDIIKNIGIPIQYLAGNHDVNIFNFKSQLKNQVCPVNELSWQFKVEDLLFIGLDSSQDIIPGLQLKWLQRILKKNSSKRVLLFVHHHVLPVGANWIDKQILKNNLELLSVIDKFISIEYIIHGHLHMHKEILFRNKNFLSCPSLSFQSSAVKHYFTLDEKAKPGFRIFRINRDQISTEVIYI